MDTPRPTRPPRLAEALLNWLVQDDLQTPLGDFEEFYHELEQAYGTRHARQWYRQHVLRLLPERLFQNLYWNLVMLKNYLVIAYRTLLKKPLVTAINLFGLSLAIACTIVSYLYIMGHTTSEGVHENGASIFLVKSVYDEAGERQTSAETPAPLGPALAADFPQIRQAVRMRIRFGAVDTGGREPFHELITFAEPGFLELFTVPMASGESQSFGDPTTVLISERAARIYFGDEDPIGQSLTLTIDGMEPLPVVVRGVTGMDRRSSLSFSILLPYSMHPSSTTPSDDDWSSRAFTFLHMADAGKVEALAGQMERYVSPQQAAVPDRPVQAYTFVNLLELGQRLDTIGNSFVHTIPWAPVIALGLIALFLLTLSCVNYINISLSTAARRLKEIGIRKVVGGNRRQLARQFLAENVLLCTLSLLIGLAVAHFLLVPAFNTLSTSDNSLLTTPVAPLALFLGGLLAGIAVLSGAYPAMYLASFQPIAIFQGTQRLGRGNRFMQGLLALQFTLAFVTMIVCVGLLLNARDERSRDWGYTSTGVVFVDLRQAGRYDVLEDYAASLADRTRLAGSVDHVGRGVSSREVTIEGEPHEVAELQVGPGYAETLALRLQAGRYFDPGEEHATSHALLVNEAFAEALGWEDPLGRRVRIDTTDYEIIGEVADFHSNGFTEAIQPTMIRLADPADFRYLTLRVRPGAGAAVAEALRDRAGTLWDQQTVEVAFQDAAFDTYFAESRGITHVFLFTALLALVLSCMGLFGLAAQNTLNRMKEISIRKVLGASLAHLALRLNRRFATLLLSAALLASPLGYLLLNALLDSIYTYRIGVGPAVFLIAYGLVFATGLLTLGSQIYRMAEMNPAMTLRNE